MHKSAPKQGYIKQDDKKMHISKKSWGGGQHLDSDSNGEGWVLARQTQMTLSVQKLRTLAMRAKRFQRSRIENERGQRKRSAWVRKNGVMIDGLRER